MEKLKTLGICAVSALGFVAGSCGDDSIYSQGEEGKGSLEIAVDLNTSVLSATGTGSRSNASSLAAEDLTLKLVSVDGQRTYELGTLGTYDNTTKFPVGNYTLVAQYGNEGDCGFEKPYYYGESTESVKIREGETAQAAVSAALANSMFTITYTDALKKYLTSYSAELQGAGQAAVAYPADETRPVYVKSGAVDVYVNVVKPNGNGARLLAASVTAEPRHHYTMTIDINDGEVSDATLSVTFSDDLETEDVEIELSDELLLAPAPEIILEAADPFEYVETTTNKQPLHFNVIARGGLSKVKLDTENAAAISAQWPESVELMGINTATKNALTGLGLSVLGLWNNPDRMAVIDLEKVVSNMTIPAGGSDEVKFTLTVTDRMGKTNETQVTAKVKIVPISFTIGTIQKLYLGSDELAFQLNYNGDTPEDVTYMYKNDRGTWSRATVKQVETSTEEDTYDVVLAVPTEGNFTFYATNGTISTDPVTVLRRASDTYKVAAENVFAHTALISVVEAEGSKAGTPYGQYATVYVSKNGGAYAQTAATLQADGSLLLTDLDDNTVYSVKVSLSADVNESQEVTFSTEEAAQLEGADMETWSLEGGNAYWSMAVPQTPWTTNNALTTSQPGTNGYAWNATSATQPVDDGHTGKAARISTVGWGSGNTAATQTGLIIKRTVLHCDNVTNGELYLGSYDLTDGASYGTSFSSRPASMSFWYKYTAKASGDKGSVSVTVYDADDNVLASASQQLGAASAYTEVTLDLDYGTSAVKAAKISVAFKSSNGSYNTVSETNLNYPAVGSTDYTSRYYGSELFVDEVTFNY